MYTVLRMSSAYAKKYSLTQSQDTGLNILRLMASVVESSKRPLEVDESATNKRPCVEPAEADQQNGAKNDKIRRRKVVLMMGYCGHSYLGMQRNVGFKTIEEDLLIALKNAELIRDDEFQQIQNLNFQRAARTDKGVSAVRQIVSLKLPENATVEAINKHLPAAIKVFAMKRVTKGFNSKTSCDARTYSYLSPTLAFSDTSDPENYRISPELLSKIREALQIYVGTHNFHNFTARKKCQDPSSIRYIVSFDCGEPFVKDGLEFITLKVKGQSFMLHQIRKMVGTVIAIVRGLTTSETITKAWGNQRLDLPIAPGLGLLLEQVHYDRYNAKYGKDGMHEALTWDEHEEEINAFKEGHITPVIIHTEKTEKSMYEWVQTLPYHSYDVREDHTPRNSKPSDPQPNPSSDDDSTSQSANGTLQDTDAVENKTIAPSNTADSA